MWAERNCVRVCEALLVNRCLKGGAEVSRYLVPQIPEETGLSQKARWGNAEGGLNQPFREAYFFVWLIW